MIVANLIFQTYIKVRHIYSKRLKFSYFQLRLLICVADVTGSQILMSATIVKAPYMSIKSLVFDYK